MGLGATAASALFLFSLAINSCLERATELEEAEDWEVAPPAPERVLRRAPLPPAAASGPWLVTELSPTVESADIPLSKAPLPAEAVEELSRSPGVLSERFRSI